MSEQTALRADFAMISEWIDPSARVLDLGCGDGALLHHLQTTRQVHGYGLEIDPSGIVSCIEHGVNVIQADLNDGLDQFEDNSFDYVLMTEALQILQRPDLLLQDMLRIGRRGIVTFPNFGHWRCRLSLLLGGRMPLSTALPNQWYNTPNIHLCTVRDFENLCEDLNIRISRCSVVDHRHRPTLGARLWPNLFGQIAVYELSK
ncbi:MAG: methionine biosynthesis protein MetW [Salinisphaeraceae bacterium]|nr:methionine biosynthesis protein MetW [Salinisphaeraceae bacterium]